MGPSDVSQENGILGLLFHRVIVCPWTNQITCPALDFLILKEREGGRDWEGGEEGGREEELNKIPPAQRALKHEEKSAFFFFS